TSTVRTIDLGTLTSHEAEQLEGKTVQVSFEVARRSLLEHDAVFVKVKDIGHRPRHVCFLPCNVLRGMKTGDKATVEGRLRTWFIPEHLVGGEWQPELLVVKVFDARRVGP